MNDDRIGIDLLKKSIEEIAPALDRPVARRRRWKPRRSVALVAAACALLGAAAIVTLLLQQQTPHPRVEVLSLKINGRPVEARVIDSRSAGSIVIVPDTARGASPLASLGGAL